MSDSKITLIGMYNFDNTLFDLLTVPAGIDKQTLIDSILLRSGEFEVLYPDINFLKYSIGAWSRKWQPTIERWINVLSLEYDPIENYNRYEKWTDNRKLSGTENSNKVGTENRSEGGSSSGSTSGSTGSTTTNSVSAYDSATFSNKDQTVVSATDGSSNSGTTSLKISSGDTMSLTVSHLDADDLTHDGRIHGNIGVMSTQNMVMQEIDVGYWNIYEKLTDIFLTEFVIPIY